MRVLARFWAPSFEIGVPGGGGATVQRGPPIVFDRRTMKINDEKLHIVQLRRLRMMFECGLQHAQPVLKQGAADLGRTACGRPPPPVVFCRVRCFAKKYAEVSRARRFSGVTSFVRGVRVGLACLSSSVIAFGSELGRTASKKALLPTSGAHDEWFQTWLQKHCSRRVVCAFGRGSGGVREDLGALWEAPRPSWALLGRS